MSMVAVWRESSTFVHGLLIFPMAAYLVWERWERVADEIPHPSLLGLVCVIGSLLLWVGSGFAHVQAGQQFAVIGMLTSGVWAILGTRFVRSIRFPLLFLFFAVPFGEFLVPKLMEWTSVMVVSAVSLLGIPVLVEGNHFALPSGNFEVAAACSGIRFLLVTVVLSTYLSSFIFANWKKRLVFVFAASAVMIAANAVRAFIIVVVAHKSNMQAALVTDHDYLGWIVFAVAITLTFWAGSRFAEPDHKARFADHPRSSGASRRIVGIPALAITLVVAEFTVLSGPLIASAQESQAPATAVGPRLPVADGGWAGPFFSTGDTAPVFGDARYVLAAAYRSMDQFVEYHIAFYDEQRQGSELVSRQNRLFHPDRWRLVRQTEAEPVVLDSGITLRPGALEITNGSQYVLLWHWYDLGGFATDSDNLAKIVSTWRAATGNRAGEALVLLATPIDDDDWTNARARARLKSFLEQHGNAISACLRPGTDESVPCSRRPRRQEPVAEKTSG